MYFISPALIYRYSKASPSQNRLELALVKTIHNDEEAKGSPDSPMIQIERSMPSYPVTQYKLDPLRKRISQKKLILYPLALRLPSNGSAAARAMAYNRRLCMGSR